MVSMDSDINCFESFKLQVNVLSKYLDKLEGKELQRSCDLLENIFKPHMEKSQALSCKANTSKTMDYYSEERKQIEISTTDLSNFDAEPTFTEKFLSTVPDESFLHENLLLHNNILEESKTNSSEPKDNCFDSNLQNSNEYSHGVTSASENSITNTSLQYESAFKDQPSPTYLDLSHQSNFSDSTHQSIKCISEAPIIDENNIESNPEIILNLCSKNKPISLKDSTKTINTSNLLLGERLLEKNDSNGSNLNAVSSSKLNSNSKDELNKILITTFCGASNTSVIHSTNGLRDEKRLFPCVDYQSYICKEGDNPLSIHNDNSKSFFKNCNTSDEGPTNCGNSEIKMNCDTNSIVLNLKKETASTLIENLHNKPISSQDSSSSSSLNLYSIFNSLNSPDKNKDSENDAEITDTCAQALDLVNKKHRKVAPIESLKLNSPIIASEKNIFKEFDQNPLRVLEVSKDQSQESSKKVNFSPLSCRKCRLEIADVTLWTEHKGTCDMNLFCIHCDIHFKSKVIYYKHMTSHKRNTCTHCSKTYSRHQLLRAHMKSEHGINLVSKTFPCQHCPRVFMTKSSLYYHLQSHALPNEKVCPNCGKFIEGEEAFQEHTDEHIRNAFFQCHLCNAIFKRRQQYKNHMEGHKKHICAYCEGTPVSFSSKKSLSKHYKSEHPTLPPKVTLNKKYNCDQCHRVFSRPSLLRDHKITHIDSKPIACRLCKTQYSQKSSLKKHFMKVHAQYTPGSDTNKTRHVCQQCGLVCTSLTRLNKHTVHAHNAIIYHNCTYCDYKTKHKHLLKRHMNNHLKKRKYLCDICGSMFQYASTLKHHTIFLHSNVRSFKCKECEKTFKNKSCLSRHTKTHSEERPYKCECGSCYKQLSHLSRHLSSAHNKKICTRNVKKIDLDEQELEPSQDKSNDSSLCYSQTITAATTTDSPVMSEEERSSNEIILTSGNAVFMTDANSATPDAAVPPIFTVLDSNQLIHLIPSSLQLQEGLHTVSLVNGELHALSLATSPSYQITSGESFAASSTGDSIIIHSSQQHQSAPPPPSEALCLQEIQNSSSQLSDEVKMQVELGSAHEEGPLKSNGTSQLTLGGGQSSDLTFPSSSLHELHESLRYRGLDNIWS